MEQTSFNDIDNKQKLPNEKAVMILGLLSYIGCCCTSGFGGALLGGIGLYLAKKDEKLMLDNPNQYEVGSLNTWKTVCIIGVVLSALVICYYIYMKATGKDVEQQEQLMEMLKQFQK
jgi:M penetrans paralogue family 26